MNDAANLIRPVGSSITLNCTVKFGPAVSAAEVPLLMVDAQLSRDEIRLNLTGPTVSGTTFTYTRQFESFERSDSGNYTCTAVVEPNQQQAPYLTENLNATLTSDSIQVTTGLVHTYIILTICMRNIIIVAHLIAASDRCLSFP